MDRAADDAPRVAPLVERLFRDEAGRLTALLTRLLGPAQLALAEDVVQEAFVAALKSWSVGPVPDNPAAWLLQVARRKALDAVRRERALEARLPAIAAELETSFAAPGAEEAPVATAVATLPGPHATEAATSSRRGADPFADDRLRMILLCCHPAVSADSRVALTLKLVSGFSVEEIARAFLADARAVAQRLVRAKQALRDAGAAFEMPDDAALADRLAAVHDVLHLMFNESHTPHAGEAPLRRDLAEESLRLVERLLADARTRTPDGHALAALICFHSARFDAREGAGGMPVRLAEQDRSRWDRAAIARGFAHLERAARGDRLSRFHLEAELASLHASAPSWEATDWPRIVAAYDRLLALAPSPVAALNRVVAVRHAHDAARAWKELQRLAKDPILAHYPLTPAVRGWLLAALDRPAEARDAWMAARALATSIPMQRQAGQRVVELDERLGGDDVDSGVPRPS